MITKEKETRINEVVNDYKESVSKLMNLSLAKYRAPTGEALQDISLYLSGSLSIGEKYFSSDYLSFKKALEFFTHSLIKSSLLDHADCYKRTPDSFDNNDDAQDYISFMLLSVARVGYLVQVHELIKKYDKITDISQSKKSSGLIDEDIKNYFPEHWDNVFNNFNKTFIDQEGSILTVASRKVVVLALDNLCHTHIMTYDSEQVKKSMGLGESLKVILWHHRANIAVFVLFITMACTLIFK